VNLQRHEHAVHQAQKGRLEGSPHRACASRCSFARLDVELGFFEFCVRFFALLWWGVVQSDVRLLPSPAVRLPTEKPASSRAMATQIPVDFIALSAVIASFGDMAVALGSLLVDTDVNPIIVGPQGVTDVDALVVPSTS